MSERIEGKYLFSWDEIPGKDSDKLIEYLTGSDESKWIRHAKIEKVDNGNTIKLSDEKNSLLLKLNNEKTSLKSDGKIIWEFIVKTEGGKLNIYDIIHKFDFDEIEELEEPEDEEPRSFGTEKDLIKFIHESARGRRFWQERLKDKIEREKKVRDLLHKNIGKFNKDILNQIFDLVDLSETYTGRWWGKLLIKPNRNRIFSNPTEKLNIWINYLLNGEEPESVRIEKCLEDPNFKLNGAGKGLVTLFLYIKDPDSFNVMMNPTIDGLERLGRFDGKKGKRKWGEYYNCYNMAAKEFRTQFELEPQSVDWVLTNISSHNIQRKDNDGFIGYWNEDDNIKKDDVEIEIVHLTKDLINKAFDELDKDKVPVNELISKLKEIVGRNDGVLVDEETARLEIQKLIDKKIE